MSATQRNGSALGANLPVLPTVCVGSYASPAWFAAVRRMLRGGELGEEDAAELFDDLIALCVNEQLEAGIDILCDGEFRRQRFVFELYEALSGLERLAPKRRLGIPGYDKAPRFQRIGPVTAPGGLGTVAEFRALKQRALGLPIKIAIPGPLTFATFVVVEATAVDNLLDELSTLVRAEFDSLVAAGCDYVQLDEPGLAAPPHGLSLDAAAAVINRTLAGMPVRTAVHVCFGNNAGRPFADRQLGRLMPALQRLDCRQLMLEFANREMAGVELLAPLSERFEIAAGVVDVKNFYLETPEDVAARLMRCLAFVPAEKLTVTADCGFSALPRNLARDKMRAMVAGARLVRGRLDKAS
jgi:5-methyltetrahydropteroyltriglutamate--homocysteine methyltransferase